jgi:hypothetical protein
MALACLLEPARGFLTVDSRQLDELVSAGLAGYDSQISVRESDALGEQSQDRLVRAAALGCGGDADLPTVAVAADDLARAATR